jgi:hypothetical protein
MLGLQVTGRVQSAAYLLGFHIIKRAFEQILLEPED